MVKEKENSTATEGISLVALEGDEQRGKVSSTEKALMQEERNIFTILWTFIKYPILVSILAFIIALVALSSLRWDFVYVILGSVIWAIIAFVVGSVTVVLLIIEIPNDPPFVGVITIFGRITQYIAPAGYFLRIPGIRDVILIDMRTVDQDFQDINIFTNNNASVEITGHAIWQADVERLDLFIRNGKFQLDEKGDLIVNGVAAKLDNAFLQNLRTEISRIPLDGPEGALGSSEKLTAKVMKHLTGYENQEEISADGIPDRKALGIRLFLVSVTNVKPSGKTKEALELLVQEEQQRKAEVYEVITRGKQAIAKKLIQRGIDITEFKTAQEITNKLEEIKKEDPVLFKQEFDEDFEMLFELQLAKEVPGAIIPGMRRRLSQPSGSIPLDVIGALLAGLLPKSSGSLAANAEKNGTKNKKSAKKRKDDEEEEEL